jgi:hypothetical protein
MKNVVADALSKAVAQQEPMPPQVFFMVVTACPIRKLARCERHPEQRLDNPDHHVLGHYHPTQLLEDCYMSHLLT